MTDGNAENPDMVVETPNVRIEVTDGTTARLALTVMDGVLPKYIGETSHIGRSGLTQGVKIAYDAECPECGHEWRRRAEDDTRATCPECGDGFSHEIPGRERAGAELIR